MNPKFRRRREAKAAGYRSALENDMARFLTERGIAFLYEQGPIEYVSPVLGGVCLSCRSTHTGKRRKYLPDFKVGDIVIETKGKLDGPGRSKLLAIKASNPTLDIRLVFQRDNRIRPSSDTHYSDWAIRHGFKYCVGVRLPPRWLRDMRAAAIRSADSERRDGARPAKKRSKPSRKGRSNGDTSTKNTTS